MTYKDVQVAKDNYDEAVIKYLRENNWEESCKNIRSIWLWEKQIGEKYFTLNISEAYEMQKAIDEENEPEEDESDE